MRKGFVPEVLFCVRVVLYAQRSGCLGTSTIGTSVSHVPHRKLPAESIVHTFDTSVRIADEKAGV